MRINLIKLIIAVFISMLICYGFYSFAHSEKNILLVIGSFITLSGAMTVTIGLDFEDKRNGINIRLVSGIFSVIFLISGIVFSCFEFSNPLYVIINGLLLLIYILITYSIYKVRE